MISAPRSPKIILQSSKDDKRRRSQEFEQGFQLWRSYEWNLCEINKYWILEQTFYILTSEGKDDNVTPSQYGTLALIVALSKEVDENIKTEDLKDIFSNVWDTDIKFLIENDYIRTFDELGITKVAPLGKAIMKNIIADLKLKNLLNLFS